MNKHTYTSFYIITFLPPLSLQLGAGNRNKVRFVRVHIRETAHTNTYVSIALLSQSDAGILLNAHTYNNTWDFTLVNQPSRGLLSFRTLL